MEKKKYKLIETGYFPNIKKKNNKIKKITKLK